MNRRQFITGTVASVAGTTALVRLASEAETSALVPQRQVILGHGDRHHHPFQFEPEVYMRRLSDGGFFPVGIIREVTVRAEVHEDVSWSGSAVMVPGLKRGTIYFEGKS